MENHQAQKITDVTKQKEFFVLLIVLEFVMLVIHALVTHYAEEDLKAEMYPQWQDVNVMIFLGFGFLMTVLRKFSYTALGITFLIGAVAF